MKPSVRDVQVLVAGVFGIRVADLTGPRRHKGVSRPRQIAMYVARNLTGESFPKIGQAFRKDHSTVIHACRSIAQKRVRDGNLAALLVDLEERLTTAPAKTREERVVEWAAAWAKRWDALAWRFAERCANATYLGDRRYAERMALRYRQARDREDRAEFLAYGDLAEDYRVALAAKGVGS